jgi:hypothetical protein
MKIFDMFRKKAKKKRTKRVISIEKQTVMEETLKSLKELRKALEVTKQTA